LLLAQLLPKSNFSTISMAQGGDFIGGKITEWQRDHVFDNDELIYMLNRQTVQGYR
jgi:hypothetical protein